MTRAALITGGARRLGKEVALHLASTGYDIALHYHTSQTEAESLAKQIHALGRRCELIQADLADAVSYEHIIIKATQAFPKLSALINNASVFTRGRLMDSDYALCEQQFRINFEAPVFLTQAFAKHVQQGVVINLLDTKITESNHPYFFYLLSKKALAEFTRMAAVELAPNIRVNGVCPGHVLAPEGDTTDYPYRLAQALPMQKTASPTDVAEAVRILIDTSALTGQWLFVDGGESLL